MFKRAKVVMLPTNEKAVGCMVKGNSKEYGFGNILLLEEHSDSNFFKDIYWQPQHLYFLSDDEIKEGDWYVDDTNTIRKAITSDPDYWKVRPKYKKIIATTDTSLKIENPIAKKSAGGDNWYISLPQPSQSFIKKYIEEYNKGNIITDVMVEYEEWHIAKMPTDFMNHLDITKGLPIIDGTQRIELKLIVKDNTITIKKLKDSWSRDEMEIIVVNVFRDIYKDRNWESKAYDWINENL